MKKLTDLIGKTITDALLDDDQYGSDLYLQFSDGTSAKVNAHHCCCGGMTVSDDKFPVVDKEKVCA